MATLLRQDGLRINGVTPKKGYLFTLPELQAFVGGYIEIIRLQDGAMLIVNEEGKLKGMEMNAAATTIFRSDRPTSDFIVGDVLLCDEGEVD